MTVRTKTGQASFYSLTTELSHAGTDSLTEFLTPAAESSSAGKFTLMSASASEKLQTTSQVSEES